MDLGIVTVGRLKIFRLGNGRRFLDMFKQSWTAQWKQEIRSKLQLRLPESRHSIIIDFVNMLQVNPRSGTQVRVRQHPEELPTEDWICSRCTVINSQETARCSTCGTAYSSTVNGRRGDRESKLGDGFEEDIEPQSINDHLITKQTKEASKLGWMINLYKTVCTVSGTFCAAQISGPEVTTDEIDMLPWLRLPIFSNGVCPSFWMDP